MSDDVILNVLVGAMYEPAWRYGEGGGPPCPRSDAQPCNHKPAVGDFLDVETLAALRDAGLTVGPVDTFKLGEAVRAERLAQPGESTFASPVLDSAWLVGQNGRLLDIFERAGVEP